jgi:AraC-like DNA-binding protein
MISCGCPDIHALCGADAKSALPAQDCPMSKSLDREDQFHWTDPGQAQEAMRLLLWPHTLSPALPGARLDARMWSRRIRNIAVSDISYGADVTMVLDRLESCYAVLIPLSGSAVIRGGNQVVRAQPDRAAVATASAPLSLRWSTDCTLRVVRIERPALDAHLTAMTGRSLERPLQFTLGMELGDGHPRIFAEEVTRLVALLDRDPRAFDSAVAAATAEQVLMTRLLEGARHNYRDQLAAHGAAAPSRIVRRVVHLIESHPEWEHTVASLADASGVSRRSLERAFRKHMGVSPWSYVKSVRLRRAHDQLRAADPEQVTVGEVARRWGMSHSQFSADYQRSYGQTPAVTLRAPVA